MALLRKYVFNQSLIFSLCLSIMCASCGESNGRKAGWTKINNGGDLDLFVDFSTLKIEGEARTIWELRSYNNGHYSAVANMIYFSKIQKITYYCSSMSFADGDFTWYSETNGKGNIIKEVPISSPTQVRIPEDSDLYMLYKYVCSLK